MALADRRIYLTLSRRRIISSIKGSLGCLVVAVIFYLMHQGNDYLTYVFAAIFAAFSLLILTGVVYSRVLKWTYVDLSSSGITVRQLVESGTIAWTDIERIELARWKDQESVAIRTYATTAADGKPLKGRLGFPRDSISNEELSAILDYFNESRIGLQYIPANDAKEFKAPVKHGVPRTVAYLALLFLVFTALYLAGLMGSNKAYLTLLIIESLLVSFFLSKSSASLKKPVSIAIVAAFSIGTVFCAQLLKVFLSLLHQGLIRASIMDFWFVTQDFMSSLIQSPGSNFSLLIQVGFCSVIAPIVFNGKDKLSA